jgi:hypothetical protein
MRCKQAQTTSGLVFRRLPDLAADTVCVVCRRPGIGGDTLAQWLVVVSGLGAYEEQIDALLDWQHRRSRVLSAGGARAMAACPQTREC